MVYIDGDEIIDYIARKVGCTRYQAYAYLVAEDVYLYKRGIIVDCNNKLEDANRRSFNTELEIVDCTELAQFISKEANLPMSLTCSIIEAESDYLESRGAAFDVTTVSKTVS